MPVNAMSNLYGPLHVMFYMLVVVIAPVLVIAGTLDTLLVLRGQSAEDSGNGNAGNARHDLVQSFTDRLQRRG